jgi:endonuclease/exonuclease/phosphatase family metal-dependent hydrolase
MKKILLAIFCLYTFSVVTGCRKTYDPGDWDILPERNIPEPEPPVDLPGTNFKVMSINMALGNNAANFGSMVDYIKEYNPDLVFLRQVDSATTRATKINRPQVIADSLGMEVYFKKNFDYQTGGFGNAVLSKYPIKEKYSQILSRTDGSTAELRSFVRIKAEIKEGQFLYFAGTELDPNADNRVLQAVDIINAMERLDAPAIFVGNFNEQEAATGQTLTYLKGAFTFACLGIGCPWNAPKANPTGVFDYITFKDSNNMLRLVDYSTFHSSANTFLPMVAEFKLIDNQ